MATPVPQCAPVGGLMQDQLDDLQARLTHQDLAIEALNEIVVRQERRLSELGEELQQLKQIMLELRLSPLGADAADEPPPPHY